MLAGTIALVVLGLLVWLAVRAIDKETKRNFKFLGKIGLGILALTVVAVLLSIK